MTNKKALEMIDEYLLTDPNNIDKDWFMCLVICRQALVDSEKLEKRMAGVATSFADKLKAKLGVTKNYAIDETLAEIISYELGGKAK